jgi:hypothetical protein
MIRHLVFFKFKPDTPEDRITELEGRFGALSGLIPEIRGYEFGRDIVRSDRSYDFALFSTFENLKALQRYQVHSSHLAVLELIKTICADIRAVDYEVEGGSA